MKLNFTLFPPHEKSSQDFKVNGEFSPYFPREYTVAQREIPIPLVPLGGFDVDLHLAIKLPSSRPPSSSTAVRYAPAGRSKMEFALEIPETGG